MGTSRIPAEPTPGGGRELPDRAPAHAGSRIGGRRPHRGSIVLSAGAATDRGRVRDGNEDAFIVDPPMYAVADGMGGMNAGEVASALAVGTLLQRVRTAGKKASLGSSLEEHTGSWHKWRVHSTPPTRTI